MELKIPIPVTDDSRFLTTLQLISSMKPFSKMRPREIELYAELLFHYNKWKDLPEKERNQLIFNYDTRLAIAEKLNMSVKTLYTIIQELKKKDLVSGAFGNGTVNPLYANKIINTERVIFSLVETKPTV